MSQRSVTANGAPYGPVDRTAGYAVGPEKGTGGATGIGSGSGRMEGGNVFFNCLVCGKPVSPGGTIRRISPNPFFSSSGELEKLDPATSVVLVSSHLCSLPHAPLIQLRRRSVLFEDRRHPSSPASLSPFHRHHTLHIQAIPHTVSPLENANAPLPLQTVSTRYAPHLASCLGLSGSTRRGATRQAATKARLGHSDRSSPSPYYDGSQNGDSDGESNAGKKSKSEWIGAGRVAPGAFG